MVKIQFNKMSLIRHHVGLEGEWNEWSSYCKRLSGCLNVLCANTRWSSRHQMERGTCCCHGFRYPGDTILDANWWIEEGREEEVVASSLFFLFYSRMPIFSWMDLLYQTDKIRWMEVSGLEETSGCNSETKNNDFFIIGNVIKWWAACTSHYSCVCLLNYSTLLVRE